LGCPSLDTQYAGFDNLHLDRLSTPIGG
jgi:hypothetical protein